MWVYSLVLGPFRRVSQFCVTAIRLSFDWSQKTAGGEDSADGRHLKRHLHAAALLSFCFTLPGCMFWWE